jgi:hypothetical protein
LESWTGLALRHLQHSFSIFLRKNSTFLKDSWAGAATVAPQEKAEVSLTDKIQLVMGPTTYDPATGELQLPIRLKNLSDQPITVQVKGFGSGIGELL